MIAIYGWVFLYAFIGIFGLAILLYFIGHLKKNIGIIDIFWSLFFVLGTYITFLVQFIVRIITERDGYLTQIIILGLISIWGFRLSYHIARRNIGKPEDRRYANFRETWADKYYLKTFLQIFIMQATWAFMIASPIFFANSLYETSLLPLPDNHWTIGSFQLYYPENLVQIIPIIIGGLVWILGFYFEAIGDRQLRKFIKNPENKGKIIETGLWKYTRHPNFFGEMTMSWGIFIITLTFVDSNPLILITIIGPIMYTLLIRFVTGVPPLEKHMITKPGFKEYMKRTSVIIPWFPKKIDKDKSE
ncbi:MAG: DUF1295 domain-containing protein [Asgard group archaeon]|nr:DUF1295 domain-containing protein [Asgard group archaeon]